VRCLSCHPTNSIKKKLESANSSSFLDSSTDSSSFLFASSLTPVSKHQEHRNICYESRLSDTAGHSLPLSWLHIIRNHPCYQAHPEFQRLWFVSTILALYKFVCTYVCYTFSCWPVHVADWSAHSATNVTCSVAEVRTSARARPPTKELFLIFPMHMMNRALISGR